MGEKVNAKYFPKTLELYLITICVMLKVDIIDQYINVNLVWYKATVVRSPSENCRHK